MICYVQNCILKVQHHAHLDTAHKPCGDFLALFCIQTEIPAVAVVTVLGASKTLGILGFIDLVVLVGRR